MVTLYGRAAPRGGFGVHAYLPFDAHLGRARASRRRDSAVAGMIRVVVVDDEALLRGGLVSLVDSPTTSTVVGEAANGIEALDVVAASRTPMSS